MKKNYMLIIIYSISYGYESEIIDHSSVELELNALKKKKQEQVFL